MDEYLPPIVTKLKADLSDLVAGFAQARLAAREFAKGVDDDLRSSLGNTGDLSGQNFSNHLRDTTRNEMKKFEKDIEKVLDKDIPDKFAKSGEKAGESFGAVMKGAMWPILIGIIAAIAPGLITMLGSIITLGIGLGFTGIAAFILKDQEMLITAATHLKDTLKKVFLDAAYPMLEPLSRGLWILANTFGELAPAFKEIFSAIAPGIVPLFEGFAGMIREMLPGLKELAPVIAQVMAAFGSTLPGLGRGFSELFQSLARTGPQMIIALKLLIDLLAQILTVLGDVFEVSAKLFQKWYDLTIILLPFNTDPFGETTKGIEKAWAWLGKLFSGIGSWFADIGKAIADWAVAVWDSIWGWVTRTGKAIGDWFVMVGHWFAELPGKIARFLDAVPGAVQHAFWAAFDAVAYALGFAMAKIWKFGQDLPGVIGQAFASARDAALNWTTQMFIDLGIWWNNFKIQLPLYLAAMLAAVYQWGQDTQAAMINWGKNTWQAVTDWVSRTVNDFWNWLQRMPEAANQMGQNTNKAILDWFNHAGEWLRQAGQDLMWGFVQGVMDANQAVYDAIVRAMNKIKQGAKDALGIHSPSTVFAEMGRFSMEGFVQGLLGGQGALTRVWAGLTPPAMPQAALAAAGGGAGGAGVVAMGGGSGAVAMVHAVFKIDGKTIVDAITPAAQERKMRSGTSGLA